MDRPPTHEDANLILRLYEMRREPRMREARRWFAASFNPTTLEAFQRLCPPGSEENASYRMVTSYWEMVASFVNRGVLHEELYFETGGEMLFVWERLARLPAQMRASQKNPKALANVEAVVARFQAWWAERAPDFYAQFRNNVRSCRRASEAGTPVGDPSDRLIFGGHPCTEHERASSRRLLLPVLAPLSLFAQRPDRPDRPPGAPPGSASRTAPERSERGGGSRSSSEVQKYVPPKPEEKIVTTHHQITLGGTAIAYTATTGTLLLREEDGKPKASVFFVAYARDGVKDAGKRPITFAFNGGPGSSSVWLHIGRLRAAPGGDRRRRADGYPPTPPRRPSGWSTTASRCSTSPTWCSSIRSAPATAARRRARTRSSSTASARTSSRSASSSACGRPASSAGRRRSSWPARATAPPAPPASSHYLQERHGMYLNGIVLLSTVLNFADQPLRRRQRPALRALPADLHRDGLVPQEAAGRPPEGRPQARRSPRSRTLRRRRVHPGADAGSPALRRRSGATSPPSSPATPGSRRSTSSTPTCGPTISAFDKELLRDQRRTVGRLDSRFNGIDRDRGRRSRRVRPEQRRRSPDRSPPCSTTTCADELGFKSDMPYEVITDRVRPWSYREASNRYLNVAEDLRRAMAENPRLKVFVANGYYDLATPLLRHRIHLRPPRLRAVLPATHHARSYYEAGHMMYIRNADRQKLHADVAAFIRAAGGNKP